jgi:predicted PurR-regulated permease PerM
LTNPLAKHWRLIALALGIVLLLWVFYMWRTFVLPFAIGLVLAYLLMPLVNWLEGILPPRRKWAGFKRVISVLVAFLLLICIVGGFLYVVVTAVIDAVQVLVESAPYFLTESLAQVQGWFEGIIARLPIEIQEEVTEGLLDAAGSAGEAIRDYLLNSVRSLPGTFSTILGFAVLPFFLFYLLKDSEKLRKGMVSWLPAAAAEHGRNVGKIIENVLGRYIRAQLMLGFIVAYFSFIGLMLLDVPFPLALALLAGVCELIPTLGPWIAGAVAVLVALAMTPDKALWVAVLYLGIQLLENNLLVPKVQSAYLRIHPAVMIVLLVFGAYIAGFWGIVLIGPLTALLVEVVKYVRDHYRRQSMMVEEEVAEAAPPKKRSRSKG